MTLRALKLLNYLLAHAPAHIHATVPTNVTITHIKCGETHIDPDINNQ